MGTYVQLYLHVVWSTWDRLPLLDEAVEPALYAVFRSLCEERRCCLIAIGGVEDHIHLLIELATTITVAKLLADLKGTTSYVMNHTLRPGRFFKWQGGYGAFTLRRDGVPVVKQYIQNQKNHHAKKTLWDLYEPSAGG